MAQMSANDKKILEEVEFYRDKYFCFDLPVPFNGMYLYPVSVQNYNEFLSCSSCLTLNKNDDPKGITMTHIEYLLNKMCAKDEEARVWCMKFSTIVELCLHIKSGLKCPKCGKFMSFEEYIMKYQDENIVDKNSILSCECGGEFAETIKYKKDEKTGKMIFVLDGHEINNVEFNKMRKFIMYQNLPDFKDDSWVDKAIRDDQAAKADLEHRSSGSATATLERKIIGVCVNTGYKIDEVMNMSMRKFVMLLGMIDDIIDYTATKQGLMSGMVSLKKGAKLEHWLYKADHGMYGKAVDAATYENQIQNS